MISPPKVVKHRKAPPNHLCALGTFAALVLALVLLYARYRDVDLWAAFTPSDDLYHPRYTEAIHIQSLFRTRANTWSNLAFVLVGLYALLAGIRDYRDNQTATPPAFTILFGGACCVLGIGSGIFHASLTRWGQQLDVASMYPPLLALMAMLTRRNLVASFRLAQQSADRLTGYLIAILLTATVLLYVYKWSMSVTVVLSIHVLGVAVLCGIDRVFWRPAAALPWLITAFAALFAGVLCRQLDVAGKFSGPDAWYQGHAIWHVFCAISLALAWRYVRDGEVSHQPTGVQKHSHTNVG